MKRIIAVLIAGIALLAAAACGEDSRDVRFLRELKDENVSIQDEETEGAIRIAKALCQALRSDNFQRLDIGIPVLVDSVGTVDAANGLSISVKYYCPEEKQKFEDYVNNGNFF
jgi:hypothetical protein